MFSKMAMQHTRQAPGRDIHKHFSLAPARSHTITASSKASATAATRKPPPHPDPYKTGPKLAKRRRGHHTCHSTLSLPPAHLPLALPHAPPHLKPRACTDGEGRRNPARLCAAVVRRLCSSTGQPPHTPQTTSGHGHVTWLGQPHGRHHKAPPQPCALTTTPGKVRCCRCQQRRGVEDDDDAASE